MEKKRSDLKTYVIFAAVMLACFVCGFFGGKYMRSMQSILDGISWTGIAQKLYIPGVVCFTVLLIAVYGFAFMKYASAKRELEVIEDLEDEEYENRISGVEASLGTASFLASVMIILTLFFFALNSQFAISTGQAAASGYSFWEVLNLADLVIGLVLFIAVNALAVGLFKKINPEKPGNIFDLFFSKKWMAASDEREMIRLGNASRKACRAGIACGLVLWIISFITMFAFHTGVMPIICVTVMLMVLVVVTEINETGGKAS